MVPVTNINQTFRGRTIDVKDCANNPTMIMEKANLNWNPIKVPLVMQGAREYREYPNRYAIVNNRTGACIDDGRPVSKTFKLHTNSEVMGAMCNLADDAGLQVVEAGCLDGGKIMVVRAELPGVTFASKSVSNRKVGDVYSGGVVFTASHAFGIPTRCRGYVVRLACLNGMTVEAELSKSLRLTHRRKFDSNAHGAIMRQMEELKAALTGYVRNMDTLVSTPTNNVLNHGIIAGVMQPSLLDKAIEEAIGKGYRMETNVSLPSFLDMAVQTEELGRMMVQRVRMDGNRAVTRLLDEIVNNQAGVEHIRGTLAQPFHAITYYTDHVRGWDSNPDSAVEYALMGEGEKVKGRALELCREVAGISNRVN